MVFNFFKKQQTKDLRKENPELRPAELKSAIAQLYEQFSIYDGKGIDFCPVCYTEKEMEYLKSTPVAEINTDMARILLHEVFDHFYGVEKYKYFLPRILEVLAPPESQNDLYGLNLFENLEKLKFSSWPTKEKEVVVAYLDAVTPYLGQIPLFEEDDESDWAEGIDAIKSGHSILGLIDVKYTEPEEISKKEFSHAIEGKDIFRMTDAIIGAVHFISDYDWLLEKCLPLLKHEAIEVRMVTVACLGRLARLNPDAKKEQLLGILEPLLADREIRRMVENTMSDIN